MFCPRCGGEAGNARFCRLCGTNLAVVSDLLDEDGTSRLRTVNAGNRITLNIFHSSCLSNQRDLNEHTAVGVFGGTEIDLTAAPLATGDTRINVVSVFAGPEILVSDDIAIRITGVSIFGAVKVRGRQLGSGIFSLNAYETPGYAHATRRLHIEATSIFGGVNIRTP